jgi:hydroxymethylpyrimidine pyrophosphatase-like HAD family hydrolase
LKAAGLRVVPITGRPIGWAAPFLESKTAENPAKNTVPWPVDAIVAENGGAAWVVDKNSRKVLNNKRRQLLKLYQLDGTIRALNAARMQTVAARVLRELPEVSLSRDSAGRETDLAFDYNEYARLPPETVAQVLAILQGEGMHTTVSSIHIHGCFDATDKWRGACWVTRELWGIDLAHDINQWVFVGDSGNDQAMFEHFTHSVGVANIERFVPQLTHKPRYVATGARGAGFAEVARAILVSRR